MIFLLVKYVVSRICRYFRKWVWFWWVWNWSNVCVCCLLMVLRKCWMKCVVLLIWMFVGVMFCLLVVWFMMLIVRRLWLLWRCCKIYCVSSVCSIGLNRLLFVMVLRKWNWFCSRCLLNIWRGIVRFCVIRFVIWLKFVWWIWMLLMLISVFVLSVSVNVFRVCLMIWKRMFCFIDWYVLDFVVWFCFGVCV